MINLSDLQRLLMPIKRKILLLIGRAILTAVDNTQKTMLIQVTALKNETQDKVEKLEDYGFTCYPPVDGNTENLILYLGGDRAFGIAIKSHNREFRPTDLSEGEVCVYDKNNVRIWIKTDKSINLKNATAINMLAASEAFLKGNTFDTWVKNSVTLYNAHTHPAPGGATGPPNPPPLLNPTGHLSTKIKGE